MDNNLVPGPAVITQKMQALAVDRMDDNLSAFEFRMVSMFKALESKMDARFTALESRMDAIQSQMNVMYTPSYLNSVARTRNAHIKISTTLLHPLVNIKDGTPIPAFPENLTAFRHMSYAEVQVVLEALGYPGLVNEDNREEKKKLLL